MRFYFDNPKILKVVRRRREETGALQEYPRRVGEGGEAQDPRPAVSARGWALRTVRTQRVAPRPIGHGGEPGARGGLARTRARE